jgi:hypothetical protein
MEEWELNTDEWFKERFVKVYNTLVDQTENPKTIYYNKNELLHKLLDLMEHLIGDGSENPVPGWFE